MLNHGGQLAVAQQQYPAVKEWLDLSTGISPWVWPVPEIPTAVWNRLPEGLERLSEAAARYYGCYTEHIKPVPGSQAAIALLPDILERSSIAIPRWGYGEHAYHWKKSGHQVVYYESTDEVTALIASKQVDHVLVINPNNPTAETIGTEQLFQWQKKLSESGGYLIEDQAFSDLHEPEASNALYGLENVIALRSVGKFFGMAGLRLGFVIASGKVLQLLSDRLPLWSVSSVGVFLGERMLADQNWQRIQRQRVKQGRSLLFNLLSEVFESERLHCGPLFISVFGVKDELKVCHDLLAGQGVWVRYFKPVNSRCCLRFGLADEAGLQNLCKALKAIDKTLFLQISECK